MKPKSFFHRSLFTVLLAISALFWCQSSAQAETTPPPKAPTQQESPAPLAATAKPVARREDVEVKTLPLAQDELKAVRADLDSAITELALALKERDAAIAAHGLLVTQAAENQTLFDEAIREANEAKQNLATANATITRVEGERDGFKAKADEKTKLINYLKPLCGVKGITIPDAVPLVNEVESEEADIPSLAKAVQSAKTPADRMKAHQAWKAACDKADKAAKANA